MNIKAYNKIYFLGIGGIGMSGIARWFHHAGYIVAGYDRTETALTKALQDENISITYSDEVDAIPEQFKNKKEDTLIIYTPAVPDSHEGYQYFLQHDFTIIKRAKALGMLAADNFGIAVAGTHGKTSVSTTVATIFNQMEQGCNAFLGGIAKNFNSNVLINPDSEVVVLEADEFDRSFLTLYPNIAILTSMDADHLDIYDGESDLHKTFETFIGQVKENGKVLLKKDVPLNKACNKKVKFYSYALSDIADFYAKNIRIVDGFYVFDLIHPEGAISDLSLGIPGLYNVENAIAAAASALLYGVDEAIIRKALKEYIGVKRRFDVIIRSNDFVLIDDYAHHPEELKACLNSVRHLYPGKKITAVFQPHLFSRTRDFMDEFASSLDGFDQVILTDIYPAREEPIDGINSQAVLSKMNLKQKEYCAYADVVEKVASVQTDVLLMLGAGNIDKLVRPLAEAIEMNK